MVLVIYKSWPKTQGEINSPLLVFSNGSPWHELLSLCYSHIMADELYLVPPHPTSPSLPPWTPSVSMCRSTWQPQLWTLHLTPHLSRPPLLLLLHYINLMSRLELFLAILQKCNRVSFIKWRRDTSITPHPFTTLRIPNQRWHSYKESEAEIKNPIHAHSI